MRCFHSGYLPLIIYLGTYRPFYPINLDIRRLTKETGYTYSEPRPSLFKYYYPSDNRSISPANLPFSHGIGCSPRLLR